MRGLSITPGSRCSPRQSTVSSPAEVRDMIADRGKTSRPQTPRSRTPSAPAVVVDQQCQPLRDRGRRFLPCLERFSSGLEATATALTFLPRVLARLSPQNIGTRFRCMHAALLPDLRRDQGRRRDRRPAIPQWPDHQRRRQGRARRRHALRRCSPRKAVRSLPISSSRKGGQGAPAEGGGLFLELGRARWRSQSWSRSSISTNSAPK